MSTQESLVSIGIPTYNRPDGLRKVLTAITSQTYKNIEIIVSDNCSESKEIEKIKGDFTSQFPAIQFYIQTENKGAFYNFQFVLKKATGSYFMWAADDDQWQGENFLNNLMKYAPDNILTFPEALIKDKKNEIIPLLANYEQCKNQIDYLKNFCSVGWGYPFYGMYNLKLFYENNLEFKFDNDLVYHNEGIFLHKIFLAGPVKYVKESQILYTQNGTNPSIDQRISNFIEYYKRTLLIYSNSNLSSDIKNDLIKIILNSYTSYTRSLFETYVSFKPSVNILALPQKSNFINRIFLRLKLTLKVLLKGHY